MIFATCLNCIDGRAQLPVIDWIKKNYGVEYVDMITDAGMDGKLSGDYNYMDSLYDKIEISVSIHKSDCIFIVGHHDCAGNPVDDDTHRKQIILAAENLSKYGFPVTITGLWLSSEWIIEEIIKK
ncbi:MAG: hypothetical protein PHF74_01745 [Dehalococcoidales bacterium]|nr:hypothetical protein [Dehalococcoidales bacterium]